MINSEWSKGFNTNGSLDNVVLYKSPYSSNVAYNSRQGKITNGVITTEFEPPVLSVEAPTGSTVYTDRLDIKKVNPEPMNVRVERDSIAFRGAERVEEPVSVEEAFRQKRKREKYGVPGLKDSHMIHAAFPIETYKKPAKKEQFTQEDTRTLIIIIMAIIAVCITGFTFGVLVPKIKFVHKIKMAGQKEQVQPEERVEAF